MSYFLRFTDNQNKRNSNDHFTGEDLGGVCCFELYCEEDELSYNIRMQAEKDDTYAKYYNGNYIVFEGSKIKDNPYGNGVIAKIDTIIRQGQIKWNNEAYTYQIVKNETL